MAVMRKLRKQIEEMKEENRHVRLDAEQHGILEGLFRKLKELIAGKERKKKKKRLTQKEEAESEKKQEEELEAEDRKAKEIAKNLSPFAYVGVIGGSLAKIDANLRNDVRTFEPFTQHITADGIEVPVSMTLHEGKKVILQLGNIVLGLGPTAAVAQLGGDRDDFTVKNLTVSALKVAPEEVPDVFEYRATLLARYATLRTKRNA
jgi:hypothetical protein